MLREAKKFGVRYDDLSGAQGCMRPQSAARKIVRLALAALYFRCASRETHNVSSEINVFALSQGTDAPD